MENWTSLATEKQNEVIAKAHEKFGADLAQGMSMALTCYYRKETINRFKTGGQHHRFTSQHNFSVAYERRV